MPPDDPHVDETSQRASRLVVDAPGAEEVAVVPWSLLWRDRVQNKASGSGRYPWVVLAATLFGLFAVGFEITVLSISIPDISGDLGTTSDILTWAITGPILAYAVVGPMAGKIADVRGARRVYLFSLFAVTVLSALTAIAWDAASLIGFRVLGAAVGAAVGPSSLAMINKLFPPERRAQALGYWSLVAAGGPVLGVVAGGPIVELIGWRAIFVAQVPLTLVALVVGFFILPETARRLEVKVDVLGSLMLALGVGSLLVALNRGPALGWSSPAVVIAFALFPAFLVAFVFVERRASHPLIPLRYFRRPNFAFPLTNQFFTNFAYMGGFILTPLLLQEQLGYGEAKTGFLSIARPLTFAITGPIAGYITTRIGERKNAVIGSLFIVGSMVLLAQVGVGTTDLLILGALALSGHGHGHDGAGHGRGRGEQRRRARSRRGGGGPTDDVAGRRGRRHPDPADGAGGTRAHGRRHRVVPHRIPGGRAGGAGFGVHRRALRSQHAPPRRWTRTRTGRPIGRPAAKSSSRRRPEPYADRRADG